MKSPKVAFVIVCWNNEKLLAECFESIQSQTYKNHTTIMVDNGSGDDSINTAKHLMPSIKVIDAKQNFGFAKGNNIGIKSALLDPEVEHVVLLNTDARLGEDWLETMVSFTHGKPRAALLQSTTLDYYDHNIIDSTHIYLARNGQATQANWRTMYDREWGPKKVFGVNAAACLITRRFIEAQPFKRLLDETMFMYLEDVDVATRATVMGWDNYLVPGARAYHMGSASTGGTTGYSNFGLYLTFRNNLGVILKNFPIRIVFRLLWAIPRSDLNTIRHLRKAGNKVGARKVVKGRFMSLFYIPIFLVKRRKVARVRTIDTKYLWQLMKDGY